MFLAANMVRNSGNVIRIDMTYEMLQKASKDAAINIEFRKETKRKYLSMTTV